jgi:GT2 family glycosyltransferase
MDADNLAAPNMIEVMADAMSRTGADCLTCYLEGFSNEQGSKRRLVYRYLSTGPCVEAALFHNVLGDANCIVSKKAFDDVGGFSTDRGASFEDWEFLAKLALKGKQMDVIPEFLHLYRHTEEGFSRNTTKHANFSRVIRVYTSELPPWAASMVDMVYATINREVNQPRRPAATTATKKRKIWFPKTKQTITNWRRTLDTCWWNFVALTIKRKGHHSS